MILVPRSSVLCVATALFVLTGAFAGCESGPKEGEEGVYWGQKLLEAQSNKERATAANHLSEVKDKASLPMLHQYLESGETAAKPKLVQLVGTFADTASIPALVAAIDFKAGSGTDKKSRGAANSNERIAKALGRLATAENKDAVDALKQLASARHVNTQLAAVVSLGNIGSKDAVGDLVDIADGHTNNFMVKNAAEALGKIGDEKAVPALVRLLFFERGGVSFYREASYSLFQIGKAAIDPLIQVYQTKYKPIDEFHIEPGVQKAKSLQVLMDIGGDKRIEKMCIDAAGIDPSDTGNALARVYGAQCTGRLALTAAIPNLKKGWAELDQSISEHNLYALAQMNATQVAGQLAAMTSFDGFVKQCMKLDKRNKREVCEKGSSQVRPPRVIALSRIAPGSMTGLFEKMSKEEKDKKLKKKIDAGLERVKAAAECGKKGEDCWIGLLKHENPRYRERAAYELAAVATKSEKAAQALLGALGDSDNEARFGAILGVWRSLPKDGVATVDAILAKEKGKTQFVRINEDLKRIRVKLARGY